MVDWRNDLKRELLVSCLREGEVREASVWGKPAIDEDVHQVQEIFGIYADRDGFRGSRKFSRRLECWNWLSEMVLINRRESKSLLGSHMAGGKVGDRPQKVTNLWVNAMETMGQNVKSDPTAHFSERVV